MGTWLFEPGHTAAMFRARHKRGAKALQQAPSLRGGRSAQLDRRYEDLLRAIRTACEERTRNLFAAMFAGP